MIAPPSESISGAELDRIVAEHPKVQEVAAVPIASELGEDEILVRRSRLQ